MTSRARTPAPHDLARRSKKYREGSFDFVAAYAILEDTWYIVPETAIRGLGAITLCSTMPKYERGGR